MDNPFKTKYLPNALLTVFIGASLIVSTAAASGSLHRTHKDDASKNNLIPKEQTQKNYPTNQSKTVGQTVLSTAGNSTEKTELPHSQNPVTGTAADNPATATTPNTSTVNSATHFSVSGGRNDDGEGDNRSSVNNSPNTGATSSVIRHRQDDDSNDD